ncbi:hypothetical protein AOLI_G00141720 [Acnodon oligacanthus]
MEGTVACREKNKRAVRSQQSAFDNGQREGRRKPFRVSSSVLPRATKREGRRDGVGVLDTDKDKMKERGGPVFPHTTHPHSRLHTSFFF